MVTDVYATVFDYRSRVQNCTHERKCPRVTQVLCSKHAKYIGIIILDPLPWTKQCKEYIMFLTYRCNKLTRAIPAFISGEKTTAGTFDRLSRRISV